LSFGKPAINRAFSTVCCRGHNAKPFARTGELRDVLACVSPNPCRVASWISGHLERQTALLSLRDNFQALRLVLRCHKAWLSPYLARNDTGRWPVSKNDTRPTHPPKYDTRPTGLLRPTIVAPSCEPVPTTTVHILIYIIITTRCCTTTCLRRARPRRCKTVGFVAFLTISTAETPSIFLFTLVMPGRMLADIRCLHHCSSGAAGFVRGECQKREDLGDMSLSNK
jgi:hypothetical protein